MSGIGFITDGQTPQAPEGGANYGYLNAPPSNEALGQAYNEEESTSSMIGRGLQRGAADLKDAYALKPMMPADEINKMYGPIGPDGKQVKIADAPMHESVAKLVAQAKANELDREGVLARGSAQYGMVGNFALGMSGFIHDPTNVASMFVPGVGEENALAGMGRVGLATEGMAARTGARVIAGGTAGIAGQAPLTALKYTLGQQEASDYDLRSAFKDMMYAAAGGAVLHAGFGAAGDAWKARHGPEEVPPTEPPSTPPPGGIPPEAKAVMDADVTTKDAAMRSAVSQVVTGREVSVDPFFPKPGEEAKTLPEQTQTQQQVYREGYAPGMTADELEKATADTFPKDEKGQAVKPGEEKVSDKDIAEKNMQKPSDAGVAQKPAEVVPAEPLKPPKSLLQWIADRGGITDKSGDVAAMGGDKWHLDKNGKPIRKMENGKFAGSQRKLIRPHGDEENPQIFKGAEKSKYHPDNVALEAHEAGYFMEHGEERPSINDLYEKMDRELRGEKQYPNHFMEHLAEDPLHAEHLSERLSIEERDHLAKEIGDHHERLMEEAERKEKEFLESRGEAWEPEKTETRTLEDLENERKQENAARESQQGTGGNEAGFAPRGEGALPEGGAERGGAAEPTGRAGEAGATGNAASGGSGDAADSLGARVAALESKLEPHKMTAEERAELADSYKAYDDAMSALAEKRQALDDCLASTGG